MFHLSGISKKEQYQSKNNLEDDSSSINISRRGFGKGVLGVLALSAVPKIAIADSQDYSRSNTMSNLSNAIENYNDSKKYVGTVEVAVFAYMFSLSTDDELSFAVEFTEKVKDIQARNNLKKDGVLGPKTLEALYRGPYSEMNPAKLPVEVKDRLEAMHHADSYKNHPRSDGGRKLYPKGKPPIFSRDYYYGLLATVNNPGTYIDESLSGAFDSTIQRKGVKAYLKQYKGKFVLGVYVDGELEVASYASPGDETIKGGVRTPKGRFFMKYWNKLKYRLTAAPTSVKKVGGGYVTDYMPNAVHIEGAANGGVFIHAGYVDGERKSHGCVRIPYKYSLGLRKIMDTKKVGKIVVEQS